MATIVNQMKAIQSLTKETRYNSLINCGLMAQSSFPQYSQFVRAPQFVPQGSTQFSYRAPQNLTSIGDLPCSHRTAHSSPY